MSKFQQLNAEEAVDYIEAAIGTEQIKHGGIRITLGISETGVKFSIMDDFNGNFMLIEAL